MTLAFFQAAPVNDYYKTPVSRGGIPKQPIPVGPTGTSPFSWDISYFSIAPSAFMQVERLGNNGRLEIQSQIPIKITKTFNFNPIIPLDPPLTINDFLSGKIADIYITVVGLDRTGAEIFRRVLSVKDEFSQVGTSNVFELNNFMIPPGSYTFTEAGGYSLGYVFQPAFAGSVYPPPLGLPNEANLENPYMNSPYAVVPGIYLRKSFSGLTSTQLGFIDFEIDLWFGEIGTGDFVGTYSKADFSANTQVIANGIYIDRFDDLTPLKPGIYKFDERITITDPAQLDLSGFDLTVTPDQFELTQDMFDSGTDLITEGVLFVISNRYRPKPPPPTYSLTLTKILAPQSLPLETIDDFGNTVIINQEPLDLAFKVEQKSNNTPPWDTTNIWTIFYTDLINGSASISGLLEGTYTVTEVGGNVFGYEGPKVTISPTLAPNPEIPSIPFSYLLPLNTSLTVTYTNTYSLPPPPTLPPVETPKTGVDGNIIIPLVLLSFGVVFITGAEVYRRKIKKVR